VLFARTGAAYTCPSRESRCQGDFAIAFYSSVLGEFLFDSCQWSVPRSADGISHFKNSVIIALVTFSWPQFLESVLCAWILNQDSWWITSCLPRYILCSG
jgi:hypothetical protein